MNKPQKEINLACNFSTVSIGSDTASIGVKIDRSQADLLTFDDLFCNRRLNGFLETGNRDDRQSSFVNNEWRVESSFDVKQYSTNGETISVRCTFARNEIDLDQLAEMSKRSGRLLVSSYDIIPEGEGYKDKSQDDATITPDTLKAEGEWTAFKLAEMFPGQKAILKAFEAAKLVTMGDLHNYTASEQQLIDLPGIGESKVTLIEDRVVEFWAANPQEEVAAS